MAAATTMVETIDAATVRRDTVRLYRPPREGASTGAGVDSIESPYELHEGFTHRIDAAQRKLVEGVPDAVTRGSSSR